MNEIAALVSDPLHTQIRNRILQRGHSTVEWRFHGEAGPTRCVSFRMIPSAGILDLPESQAAVQQALMRFKTKQVMYHTVSYRSSNYSLHCLELGSP
jgi:hypothetical protein